MTSLSAEARTRILDYVVARFGRSAAKSRAEAVTGVDVPFAERTQTEPSAPGQSVSASEPAQRSLPELLAAARPETEAEKALIAAYWVQQAHGGRDFEARPVNDALKQTGHGVSNITREFDRLMAREPALVLQVQKKGSTQQARKRYRLSDAGVEAARAACAAN